jgi:uncharacterized protein YidB (DUF937 family)
MGLLDIVTGLAGQAMSSGGNSNPLLTGVLGMLQNHEGGVGGLVKAFQDKGLGEVAASWVGKGENLPISGEQLQSVLGSDMVSGLAAKFGVSQEQIAQMLPQVVDKLTPNGQVESGGFDASKAMGMLQGMFNK